MKAFVSAVMVCLILLVVACVAMITWQFWDNRRLEATNRQLQESLASAETAVTKISHEKDIASLQFDLLEMREQQLQDRVAALEAAARSAEESKPRPYRVRAFVGRDNVGQAWIVPHNVAWNEETGRYTFEPVLWIDESSKGHFTVYETNVVERNVFNTTVYEDDYGYPYYPYYYYAGGRPWNTNRPPVNPQPPNTPTTPGESYPQPSARAQIFAPPMSRVNARPQVVGQPATSPMNIKVFAP